MVRLLSLALSVSIVASTFAYQNLDEVLHKSKINSRQLAPGTLVSRSANTCIGSGWEIEGLNRFTAIFFGDFYAGGSQDILGPLAVEGDFHAPDYNVNANGGSDCDDEDSLDCYGLIVGGITNTRNTQVRGSAYLGGAGTVDNVATLNDGCVVTEEQKECLFDFDAAKNSLVQASIDFASLDATLFSGSDNTLTSLCECGEGSYEVITFNSCGGAICSTSSDSESYPSNIFFGVDNWSGTQGSKIDHSKTYILNIPVLNGETIVLDTNNPSLGFNPYNTVYNIYPVNGNGEYCPEGEVTVIRKTANQLSGFILAPKVHIVDGCFGSFAGTVIGLSYTWEDLEDGVGIQDYNAAGCLCDYYLGCTPEKAILSEPSCSIIPSTTTTPGILTRTTTETRIRTTTDTQTTTDTRTTTATESLTSTVTSTITTTVTTTIAEEKPITFVSLQTISYKEIETTCDITDPATTVTQSIAGPITTVTQTLAGPIYDAAMARPLITVTQRIAGPTVTVTGLTTTITETLGKPINDIEVAGPTIAVTRPVTGPTTNITEALRKPINDIAKAGPVAADSQMKLGPSIVTITKTITDCPAITTDYDLERHRLRPEEEFDEDIYNKDDDYDKYHRGHHHARGEECTEGVYNKEHDKNNQMRF